MEESEAKEEMEESEINKRVEMLMERFMAERGCYVRGQRKVCGKHGLALLAACGQWILRCYHNPEHESISGWV